MPDVGILNLQIHDDSAKAADGLSKLVAKLEEMKNATSKIRLGTVATGIKRINDELSKVQPSAIYKLKQLADVLDRIGSISGNVGGIRISFGGRGQSAEDMAAQLQAARDAVAQTTGGFEQIGQRVQEDVQGAEAFANTMGRVNEIVQQTGWTAQATAEQFAQMFQVMNSIRMSGSLGGGASPFALGDGTGGSGADWTYWKDGAIEVEGTVTDAMEAIGVGAGEAIPLLTGVVDATDEIASSVQEMANGSKSFINTAPGFNDVAKSVQSAAGGVHRYYNSLEDAFNGIRNGQKIENDLMSKWLHGEGTENEKLYAIKTMATQFGMSTDDVRAKIAELTAAENGLTGATQETTDAMNSINGAADEQKKSLKELIIGTNGLNGAFKRMFPTLSGLLGRFSQLVKYRMLRAVIKQIAEGFREGTENYYRYSQAIGGEFATKMDNAATALLQMKNSIGAAAAPLINSLIPYLQMAVNWFINIINYANQFIALLRGQSTWTEAVEYQTTAYNDNASAANNAAKAAKDLLADWDELNIIQSEGGGGGGGSSSANNAQDYSQMFQEVSEYDERIKKLVDGIKERFGSVLELVKRIAMAILGWKLSNAFTGWLGTIGGLVGAAITLDIVFNLVNMFASNYLKTGDKGWLIGDLLTTLIGGVLTKKILSKVLGGKFAVLAIPFTLAVSAFANAKAVLKSTNVDALSEENITTSMLSALEMGGALGYLLYKAGGFTLGYSAGMGGGAALMTFGVLIGLSAIKNTIDTHEITPKTIETDLIAAGAFGGGLSLMSAAAGVGLAGTLALGGVGAVAMFGVLIGLELIAANTPDAIKWGNETATREQIETYIKNSGFTVDVAATLQLVEDKISVLPEERQQIEKDAAKLISTLKVIKYGLASADTYTQLKKDLFGEDGEGGVIGRIKTYAKDQTTLLETTFSLMPIVDPSGATDEEATKEALKAGITGWKEVEDYMGTIGDDLANALKGHVENGIQTFDDELIAELMEKLTNVQRAMSNAEISSQTIGGLASGLTNVTKETFSEAVTVWEDYKNQLRDKYNAALTEELTSYQSLAAFYRERGNEGDDKLAKYYQDKADGLVAMWNSRLETSVSKAAEPGREMFRKAIFEMLNIDISDSNIEEDIAKHLQIDPEGFMMKVFNGGEIQKGWFATVLDNILESELGEDYETVKKLIDARALQYSDLIDKDFFSNIINKMDFGGSEADNREKRKQLQEALDNIFGDNKVYRVKANVEAEVEEVKPVINETETSDAVTEAIDDVINQVMLPGSNISEIISSAREYYGNDVIDQAMPQIQSKLDEYGLVMPDIEYDVEFDADSGMSDPIVVPPVDPTQFNKSMDDMRSEADSAVAYVKSSIESLSDFTVHVSVDEPSYGGGGGAKWYATPRAGGGFVRSGDLVMANENGNFEMMGKMGNQPVVANNQQIVSGISQGVSTANEDVVSELRVLTTLMQKMLNKEFVAKAVPSSGWCRNNQMSADAYGRVTG